MDDATPLTAEVLRLFREYRHQVGKTIHDLGGYKGLATDFGPLGDLIENKLAAIRPGSPTDAALDEGRLTAALRVMLHAEPGDDTRFDFGDLIVSLSRPSEAAKYIATEYRDIAGAASGSPEPVLDVERLAEAMHDAMCDISHHDRPPARCSKWSRYPNIAASVAPRYAALTSLPSDRSDRRPTPDPDRHQSTLDHTIKILRDLRREIKLARGPIGNDVYRSVGRDEGINAAVETVDEKITEVSESALCDRCGKPLSSPPCNEDGTPWKPKLRRVGGTSGTKPSTPPLDKG